MDGEDNIFVADYGNDCIQKFTANGQFLSAVGTKGEGPLQFNSPTDIAFNAANNKVYVIEKGNDRVQVLNSDLSFCHVFGEINSFYRENSHLGPFKGDRLGIACNSVGDVYVADPYYFRILVFTAEGELCYTFGKDNEVTPLCIAIDTNDVVYVGGACGAVSVFTSNGQFVTSFDHKIQTYITGIGVDSDGVVYACDELHSCIQVF